MQQRDIKEVHVWGPAPSLKETCRVSGLGSVLVVLFLKRAHSWKGSHLMSGEFVPVMIKVHLIAL